NDMNVSRRMRLNSKDLAALRYFEAAARLQSFVRAAEELSITQGAVSQQIKHLEGSLGCKLFCRLPGRIRLTDEGKRFAEVVARGLKGIDEEAARIANPGRAALKVRLRAGPSFAQRWLAPRLGTLQTRHPDITLHVIADYGYF